MDSFLGFDSVWGCWRNVSRCCQGSFIHHRSLRAHNIWCDWKEKSCLKVSAFFTVCCVYYLCHLSLPLLDVKNSQEDHGEPHGISSMVFSNRVKPYSLISKQPLKFAGPSSPSCSKLKRIQLPNFRFVSFLCEVNLTWTT